MNLDEAQRKQVSKWISEGLRLSDIQNRLSTEFGLRLTYMDVRLLVDDLKLMPKDIEPAKPADVVLSGAKGTPSNTQPGSTVPPQAPTPLEEEEEADAPATGVTVSVDSLARPGAIASGKVTFSDGQTAQWYFDQTGRLGLVPPSPGYRPAPQDIQAFQQALDRELSKLGL